MANKPLLQAFNRVWIRPRLTYRAQARKWKNIQMLRNRLRIATFGAEVCDCVTTPSTDRNIFTALIWNYRHTPPSPWKLIFGFWKASLLQRSVLFCSKRASNSKFIFLTMIMLGKKYPVSFDCHPNTIVVRQYQIVVFALRVEMFCCSIVCVEVCVVDSLCMSKKTKYRSKPKNEF